MPRSVDLSALAMSEIDFATTLGSTEGLVGWRNRLVVESMRGIGGPLPREKLCAEDFGKQGSIGKERKSSDAAQKEQRRRHKARTRLWCWV